MTLRRILLVTALLVLVPVASANAALFAVEGGYSDNYKASFNSDPSIRELRTWMSFDRIRGAGTTWAPATPGSITFAQSQTVLSADGRSAQLTVTSTSANIASVFIRTDPPTTTTAVRWGPLVTLRSPIGPGNAKARIGLSLTSGGSLLATGVLDYWATSFSGTGSSIEANGPNGRWRVSGYPLFTDWETGRSPSGVLEAAVPIAPRATGVKATRSGATIRVRALGRAVQGARIPWSRYRIGSGRYTAWRRASSPYAFRLARGSKTRVTVQVRDVRGFASKPVMRVVG